MPIPDVPVDFVEASSPPAGPAADIEIGDDSVSLTMPRLGQITVDSRGIQVFAPTPELQQRTWDRLGRWASAQWLHLQGIATLCGAAVARDGRAVVIMGVTRAGTSATAAALCRRGWSLLSDGVAAIDSSSLVLAGAPFIRLDRPVVDKLFPHHAYRDVDTGRPRREVRFEQAPDTPLHSYIALGLHEGAPTLAIAPGPVEVPPEQFRFPDHTPRACRPTPPPAPALLVRRPIPMSLEQLQSTGPVALADRLADLLEAP